MDDVTLIGFHASGVEGGFAYNLRYERIWNEEQFNELTGAMHRVAQKYEGCASVERSLAHCYFFFSSTIPVWLKEGHIEKNYNENYYERAMFIFRDLNQYLLRDNDPFLVICDQFSEVIDQLNSYKAR